MFLCILSAKMFIPKLQRLLEWKMEYINRFSTRLLPPDHFILKYNLIIQLKTKQRWQNWHFWIKVPGRHTLPTGPLQSFIYQKDAALITSLLCRSSLQTLPFMLASVDWPKRCLFYDDVIRLCVKLWSNTQRMTMSCRARCANETVLLLLSLPQIYPLQPIRH